MIGKKELKNFEKKGYRRDAHVGKAGLEKAFEDELRGRDGLKTVMVDALGWPRNETVTCKPVIGNTLELTIDFEMQMALERAIEGKQGAAVLLDTATGDILAMASYPVFDPNLFIRFIPSGEWSRLKDKKRTPLTNRALEGEYQPGSTFKVVTGCAALKHEVLDESTSILCNGRFSLGKRVAFCWKPGGHGNVQFRRAISQSCNVYFYTIGSEIDVSDLADVSLAFGLGYKTGICLSNERTGIIPDDKWRKIRNKNGKTPWTRGDTVNSAIGQGDVLVTPLQMARVAAAVTNGGKVFRPRLIRRIISPDGDIISETSVEEVSNLQLTPEILDPLRDGMKECVQAGTAWRTKIKGVTVLGKTGSAENPGRKTHAWFIGAMETHTPSVAIAVLLENAGAGGSNAVPVAFKAFTAVKEIIERRNKEKKGNKIKSMVGKNIGTFTLTGELSVSDSLLTSSTDPSRLTTDSASYENVIEVDHLGVDPDDVEGYGAGEDELYMGTL